MRGPRLHVLVTIIKEPVNFGLDTISKGEIWEYGKFKPLRYSKGEVVVSRRWFAVMYCRRKEASKKWDPEAAIRHAGHVLLLCPSLPIVALDLVQPDTCQIKVKCVEYRFLAFAFQY